MFGSPTTISTATWPQGGWSSPTSAMWPSSLSVSYSPAPVLVAFGRTEREARRAFSRAKAIPPIHIPGNPEDRIAPLAPAYMGPEQPRPAPIWLTGRRGAPRQKTCSRSRRRLRTWERDEDS